jgi:hypothetical protein
MVNGARRRRALILNETENKKYYPVYVYLPLLKCGSAGKNA